MLVHSRTSHKERRGGGRNGLAAVGGEYYLTTQQETYDNVTCQTAVLHEFSVGMKAQSTYLCVALLLLHLHTVLCVSIYVFSFLPFYTFSIFYFFLSLSLSFSVRIRKLFIYVTLRTWPFDIYIQISESQSAVSVSRLHSALLQVLGVYISLDQGKSIEFVTPSSSAHRTRNGTNSSLPVANIGDLSLKQCRTK